MKVITKEEFDQTIANGLTVVDFYADWCGPCKMLGPVLEEVQEKHPEVTIVKVNVDNDEELAARFRVMSIPYVLVFKNGIKVDSMLGYHGVDEVDAMVMRNM